MKSRTWRMGLLKQYLRLLWQEHYIVSNTSKYLMAISSHKIVNNLCSLLTFRGCVTNGKKWVFFIFNANDFGEGGTVSISEEFHIEEDLSGLPLVLGLLSDWVSFYYFSSFKDLNLIFI